ncbi:glycoside hydrolase family 81 protein [Favolaschia claudopus]|uniref:Glycoside hydrolase family 81 protein n=1 Tax=Favolaschia claudopus TaxID=2862362 RepID=A0AAW0E5S8_9AGAR
MRFATLTTSVFLAVVGVCALPHRDDRLLYIIPVGKSMDQFTTDFTETCRTWYPAIHGDSYTFLNAIVQPGDWQGKNADTEAKIACAWIDPSGNIFTYTEDVAAALGAVPAPA